MRYVSSRAKMGPRRYDLRGRESMKPRTPRVDATMQLNLPLLQGPMYVVPADQQAELVGALVALLIDAAHVGVKDGGDDESEANR
jgi:hypothetical protein